VLALARLVATALLTWLHPAVVEELGTDHLQLVPMAMPVVVLGPHHLSLVVLVVHRPVVLAHQVRATSTSTCS
jgi:hypothetical protein